MRIASSRREEYIKFRLKEWGVWLGMNYDGTAHLRPKCLLGILINQHKSTGYSSPNEDECDEINQAYYNLKAQHESDADCLYMYYVASLIPSAAAKRLGISENTFYDRKRSGERFISGAIA